MKAGSLTVGTGRPAVTRNSRSLNPGQGLAGAGGGGGGMRGGEGGMEELMEETHTGGGLREMWLKFIPQGGYQKIGIKYGG